MINRFGLAVAGVAIASAVEWAPSPAAAQTASKSEAQMQALIRAYPAALAGLDINAIIWKDGTRTLFDDGTPSKPIETLLASPDLKDMFHWPYPWGRPGAPPLRNNDPGRVRNEAFFARIYGDCRKGEVVPQLVDVIWLPKTWGKAVKFTRTNGASDALAKVSAELDQLPARFLEFLKPTGGAYNCRPIAGTRQISAHGFGIAIDINTKHSAYWRWTGADKGGLFPYRNAIPFEIVEIFEKHGFIWGGKWYHYDTMHFEYRPELLPRAP